MKTLSESTPKKSVKTASLKFWNYLETQELHYIGIIKALFPLFPIPISDRMSFAMVSNNIS